MSEVFVTSPKGYLRYFAPAIVVDISTSGLALEMDSPPRGHTKIVVRNSYFHAEVLVRNTIPKECGFRVGCELATRLEWQPERGNVLATRAAL